MKIVIISLVAALAAAQYGGRSRGFGGGFPTARGFGGHRRGRRPRGPGDRGISGDLGQLSSIDGPLKDGIMGGRKGGRASGGSQGLDFSLGKGIQGRGFGGGRRQGFGGYSQSKSRKGGYGGR